MKICSRLILFIFVGVALASATPALGSPSPNGYAFERAITISHTKVPNTDQINFPVLIYGTYSYLATIANGGNVTNASGYDIIFTSDAAGANLLNWELVNYNAATGAVEIWVKVPDLSHTADTMIYMWYGNSGVSTFQGGAAGAAWDGNYAGVYHLPNGMTLSASDSTSNGNNGTSNGATAVTGEIDGGAGLGSAQSAYISFLGGATLNGASQGTIELWVKWTSTTEEPGYSNSIYGAVTGRQSNGAFSSTMIGLNGPNPSTASILVNGNTYQDNLLQSTAAPGLNVWTHVAITFNSAGSALYVDGTTNQTKPTGITFGNNNSVPMTLGAWIGAGDSYSDSNVDEFRVSTIARSADWIATEYNNQSSPSAFYSISSPASSGSYANMKTITISHAQVPNTDQINFPVLIYGTYSYLATIANGGNVTNANGYDLIFTSDAGGLNLLNWELANYNATTGAVEFWVKIPDLSHTTDTVIYLWYGNSGVSTFQGGAAGAAWDSNYVGVWHLPNGTVLSAGDSTSNGNNGTITGATATTGEIDGGASLSGNSQYITVGNGNSLQDTGNLTIEAWIKPTDFSNYDGILGKTAGGGGNIAAPYDFYLSAGGGTPEFYSGNGTAYSLVSGQSAPGTGVWSQIAVTLSGNTATHYLNGLSNGGGTEAATPGDGGTAAIIGSRHDLVTMFKGGMDEVRVSNIARSADWIATEYNNQSSPSTFYTIGSSASWANGYTYARVITINSSQVPTAQTNFPVLIYGTYSYLATIANGGNVTNANGYDLIFTSDAGGLNLLNWQLVNYNPTTGAVEIWVKIPDLSHTTDTVIYLWYGNSGVSTFQGGAAGAAWDSNYVGVWHLPNGTVLSAGDSTSNGNNGTITGATATTGEIDGGASLSGNSQYITVGNGNSLQDTGNLTIEAWIKPTDFSNYDGILGKTAGAGGNIAAPYDFYLSAGGGTPEFYSGNGTAYSLVSGQSAPGTGVWSQIAVTLSGNTATHYLNGLSNGGGTEAATPGDGGTAAIIGSRHDLVTMFKGGMDEVRVSNIARSADWIATEYNNQSNPSIFYSIGTATTGGGTLTPAVTITNLSPTSGTVGIPVTISGSNFGSSQGSGTVQFNGTIASVSSWSSTSISTTVPVGATTGDVVVSVAGANSNGITFAVLLSPPTGLTATAGSTQVSLTWNGSAGATSYNIYSSTTNGGPYSEISSVTTASYTNTGLSNGTTYYYVVTAVNSSGQSVDSNQASAMPSNGYTYGRAITINSGQVPTAQTNFPVLIYGTYSYLATIANGGNVTNANGYDLIFTSDAGGLNLLNWQLVNYNPTTGAVEIWVKIPDLSHTTDTVIYLWYGNSGVSTFQGGAAGAAWDSNYVGVWHLPNGTVLSAGDSTSNGNNGTITGATATTGEIDGGASLSGNSQYITVGNGNSLQDTGNLTIEAWIKPTDFSNYDGILGKTAGAGGNIAAPYDFYLSAGGGTPEFYSGNGTAYSLVSGQSAPGTGVWSQIAVTLSGNTATHYLNGLSNGGGTEAATPGDGGTAAIIGSRHDLVTMFKGGMDEVRVSNIARSADWIATEYNNQSNPSIFYSIGTATTGGGISSPVITVLSPTSGVVGTPVTISGSNFGSSQGSSTVQFSGTSASVSSWSSTSISTTVPAGAITGNVVVSVGGINSNDVSFTVVSVPSITSLSPPSAVAGAGGQTLTLNGTNFLSTSTVTYNGVGHAATYVSSTQLTISLSVADQATAGSYAVVVTNPGPGGGVSGAVNFAVTNPSSSGQLMVLDPTGHYLVNTFTNQPVFITGDTAYDLSVQISSDSDLDAYLADRQAKGINAIWIALIDAEFHAGGNTENDTFGNNPWNGGPDFTGMSSATAYWANVDHVLQKAASYGITVVAGTAFTGTFNLCNGPYYNTMASTSDATMQAYGAFLGNRYASYSNIIWLMGGDANYTYCGSGLANKLNDIAVGIRSADQVHLMAIEATNATWGEASAAEWSFYTFGLGNPNGWITLGTIYPKGVPASDFSQEMGQIVGQNATETGASPFVPYFSIEDEYETEPGGAAYNDQQLRQEGYAEVLGGAYLGRLFGSSAIWPFNSSCCEPSGYTWQTDMDATPSSDQQRLGQLFRSREHWKLVADVNNTVVTNGYGAGATLTSTARTSDGQTIISYIPNGNGTTLTVNMSQITSGVDSANCWWFNPRDGSTISIGTLPNAGSHNFTPPDSNDWVLVIDDPGASLPAPGSANY